MDIVPAKLLVEVLNIVGPSLLIFRNFHLSSGHVPAPLKRVVLWLLLKKPQLDPSMFNHILDLFHICPFFQGFCPKKGLSLHSYSLS